jgi:hypothetical protein
MSLRYAARPGLRTFTHHRPSGGPDGGGFAHRRGTALPPGFALRRAVKTLVMLNMIMAFMTQKTQRVTVLNDAV